MKIQEIAKSNISEQPGDWRTDPAARKAKEREQALQTDPISQMFTPGASSAEDLADVTKGDYSALPFAALGVAPGGGMWSKGAKKLKKWLGKSDDAADVARKVEPKFEPPKAPTKDPKGPVDLEKEFAKREAERVAAAEKEIADRAAAEAERLKNLELPKQGRLESDKKYLDRLQKMGPEYAAKHRQNVQDLINLKTAKTLERGVGKKAAVAAGKYIGVPAAITGTGAVAWEYAPDVIDYAKEKLKKDKEEAQQQGGVLPFPEPESTPEQPPGAPAAPAPAEQPAEQPAASDSVGQPAEQPAAPAGETPLEKQRREKGLPASSALTSNRSLAERKVTLEEKYQRFLNEAEEKPTYTTEQYIGWAKKYAEQYNVPLPMVLHAMFKETGWIGNPERMRVATSPTGAKGVMQIQPQYAEKGAYKIKVKDLTDPEKNIEAGVRGLAYYFNKHKTPEKALAAYNAGEGGASQFLKTGNVNTIRSEETRNYIKDYKDDVIHQLEKFYPRDKKKVAQVATNILATAVGAGKAQAADEVPSGTGGPEKVNRTREIPRAPNAAELAKLNKQLQNYKDPVKELEKIIQQADAVGQRTGELTKELDALKKDYDKNKPKGSETKVSVTAEPGSIADRLQKWWNDDKTNKGDKTTQKSKPAGSTTTVTDTQGRSITYTKNDKGQWISKDGQILPMPTQNNASAKDTKADSKPKTQQSVSGKIERPVSDVYPDEVQRGIKPASTPDKKSASEPAKTDKKRAAPVSAVTAEPAAEPPAEKINVRKEFEKAFAQARAKQIQDTGKGSGGVFTWKNPVTGKESTYTTDYGDEVAPAVGKKEVPADSKEKTFDRTADLDRIKQAQDFDVKPAPKTADEIASDKLWGPLRKEMDALSQEERDRRLRDAKLWMHGFGDLPDADAKPVSVTTPSATTSPAEKSANVLRSADGSVVTSGTGEPLSTGTSTQQDIAQAKDELQKQIDTVKAKQDLEKISPDLTLAKPSFQDYWDKGIETLTGKKRLTPDEMNKIQVPESVNTELKDILWLAGRTKK